MDLGRVLVLAGLAGAAIPVGAAFSLADRHGAMRSHAALHRGIIAFGGGILLGAVAVVLVPEGFHAVSVAVGALAFGGGTFGTLLIDRAIERRGGRSGQVVAMVLDYVPESVALGAAFAVGGGTGPLLALLIALQNLPEAFNGHAELVEGGLAARRAFGLLAPLSVLGPLAAATGFLFLAGSPGLVGVVALAASGGIVYLVFHDVAPAAFSEGHWLPTAGASRGFLVAVVGERLVG